MIFFNTTKDRMLKKLIKVVYYIVYHRRITQKEIQEYLDYVKEVENEQDRES